mmetsp:Transcript_18504/g.54754  ORF Transcript_18504/g.54754 Transcript_18504/m.54754 type:complete len:354 (-) Transcript_18504:978-2039(-)
MIGRSSSWSRCIARMIEPSYASVILQRSANFAPPHQSKTRSTRPVAKRAMYSSTSTGSFASSTTVATRLASSRIRSTGSRISRVRIIATGSSFLPSLPLPPLPPNPCSATRHDRSAASCAGSRSWKRPANTSSVTSSSSEVLTSHATRPLLPMTPSSERWPSRRSTRRMPRSSSFISATCPSRICRLTRFSSSSAARRSRKTASPAAISSSPKLTPPSRSCTPSSLRASLAASCAAVVTLRSSSCCSSGTPSAKRLSTSRSTLSTACRPSLERRSFGRETFTFEKASTRSSVSVSTCSSALSSSRAGAGSPPASTAASAPASHRSSTSMWYWSAVPRSSPPLLPSFLSGLSRL